MPKAVSRNDGSDEILNKDTAYAPMYRTVANQIAERITSGEWQTGTVLPSETALALEFRVSVGTIRRALGELVSEGTLARRRKTGTVVTGRTPRHSLRFYYTYFRLHSRAGDLQNSTARVLELQSRAATTDEARRLAIPEGTQVHALHRLRLVNDRPVMHETIVIPCRLVPGFPTDPARVPARLYPMLWNEYGLKISAIREQIEASIADAEDHALLNLSHPAAVLVLREVAYDEQAQPILLNSHRATTSDDVYINEIQ
ncbi:GntR family transcriptional regulator [Paracoccus onubensis]|uniref:GntR family transcriptional regulator n=2 Tax=Paracoccus onubensis TaxID=1675788 RepID=A0A418SSZ6_9RHOB|nr:GntR family transcriptional regulator [Paracoccus onubensis]